MNSIRYQTRVILLLLLLPGCAPMESFGQYTFSQLRSFGFKSSSVLNPKFTPTITSFGVVGVTAQGGDFDKGVLYKIDLTTSRQSVLHHFQDGPTDGAYPSGPLAFIHSNLVVGATSSGGEFGLGTLFTCNLDTGAYAILHHFAGGTASGAGPVGSIVVATTAGVTQLFGVTESGGSAFLGTLYRINEDGNGYTTLRFFTGDQALGNPTGGLSLLGSAVFGTTTV